MQFLYIVAGYLMDLVKDSGLNLKMGLVQTAYANGNATKYIRDTLVSNELKIYSVGYA